MDIYKQKWTRLQYQIFKLLCVRAGSTLNIREIARVLNISPTAVSKSLDILKKQNLIKINKVSSVNLCLVELNKQNKKAIEFKRVENLRSIYESGLSDFLFNEFPGATVILFGSYSKGEDIYTTKKENCSDIDIAVIGSKEKSVNLRRYSTFLERDITINFYDSWKKIHKYLKNNLLNGIVLSGGVDL